MKKWIGNTLNLLLACLFILLSNQFAVAQKAPVYAKHGMVVSAHHLASQVGADILKQGGNAVDAAVATAFALAVVHPSAGNIGGGGFMIIRLADGTTTTVDYREKAPKAATEKMFMDDGDTLVKNLNHRGYLAVGVPGTVAGLTLALEKYGSMPLKDLVQPAIKLAENGFEVSYSLHKDIVRNEDWFKEYPASEKAFFRETGEALQPGDNWVQQDLAASLTRIAENGRDGFYRGKTAEIFESVMKANGGLITKEDLADYRAVIREPIVNTYRDYTIYSMPPPSSGGVTLSIMLNILEGYDLADLGHNSADYVHLVVEAMRRAYEDRAEHLGDPDFNPDMPVERLISKEYAAGLRSTINSEIASVSDPEKFDWEREAMETTHFSVVDAAGNTVSNTYTLEYSYGSKIVLDGAGFLLNNEMGDFNAWPGHTDTTGLIGTKPNLVEPEKRMLSSMTPTIVAKGDKTLMAIGSPGGRTIITTVLQCILNVVDFDMNIYESVSAPRFHHQWLPDKIRMEKWGTSKDSIKRLKEMGHTFTWRRTYGRAMGIIIDPETGFRMGGADPRSPNGKAVGY